MAVERRRQEGRAAGDRTQRRDQAVRAWTLGVSAGIVVTGMAVSSAPDHFGVAGSWLRGVSAFLLAFFPGWLLARFISVRRPVLWAEFTVNLHRLGVDGRAFLPEPPVRSEYLQRWRTATTNLSRSLGEPLTRAPDLYAMKFQSIYGEVPGPTEQAAGGGRTPPDRMPRWAVGAPDHLVPVLLVTTACALGWTAIVTRDDLYLSRPVTVAHVLAAAFLGAYVFDVQMLVRRYFQNDLKPGAYVSAFLRLVTAVVLAGVVFEVVAGGGNPPVEPGLPAVAFLLGFFPMVGMAWLKSSVTRGLRRSVGSLEARYPLSELDGLNLWYETRLVEEGIEDMTSLVDANVADVLLNTRVPVGRLVDWLDQAHLYLHLPPARRDVAPSGGGESGDIDGEVVCAVLRRAGIFNATTLLAAFGCYTPVEDEARYELAMAQTGRCAPRDARLVARVASLSGGADQAELARWIDDEVGRAMGDGDPARAVLPAPAVEVAGDVVPPHHVRILDVVRVLANQTTLTPVLNWRQWGAERHEMLLAGEGDEDDPVGHRRDRADGGDRGPAGPPSRLRVLAQPGGWVVSVWAPAPAEDVPMGG